MGHKEGEKDINFCNFFYKSKKLKFQIPNEWSEIVLR